MQNVLRQTLGAVQGMRDGTMATSGATAIARLVVEAADGLGADAPKAVRARAKDVKDAAKQVD